MELTKNYIEELKNSPNGKLKSFARQLNGEMQKSDFLQHRKPLGLKKVKLAM